MPSAGDGTAASLPAVRPQRIILRAVFFPEQFEQIRSCIYLRKVLMDEALREIDGNPVPLTSWNAVLPFVLRGEIPPSDSPYQDTNASAGPAQTGEIHNSVQTV